MNSNNRLKDLLDSKQMIIAPGAYDVLSARLIEHSGFPAVYVTGSGVAASMLGLPDYGLMTMSEILDTCRRIVRSVDVPVIADADTGYGNHLNVYRAVKEYDAAGVSAIQLEDQVFPKRCGHMQGKEVISLAEHAKKIETAAKARANGNILIIARTDARAPLGFSEALARGKAYAESGADIIFIQAPQSIEELNAIAAEIKVPLMVNVDETGKTQPISAQTLAQIGFQIIIFPLASLLTVAKAALTTLKEIKEQGTTKNIKQNMVSFFEFTELVDIMSWQQLEKGK